MASIFELSAWQELVSAYIHLLALLLYILFFLVNVGQSLLIFRRLLRKDGPGFLRVPLGWLLVFLRWLCRPPSDSDDEFRRQHQSALDKNGRLLSRCSSLADANASLRSEVDNLRAANGVLQKTRDREVCRLISNNHILKDELDRVSGEKTLLKDEVHRLRSHHCPSAAELSSARKKVAVFEKLEKERGVAYHSVFVQNFGLKREAGMLARELELTGEEHGVLGLAVERIRFLKNQASALKDANEEIGRLLAALSQHSVVASIASLPSVPPPVAAPILSLPPVPVPTAQPFVFSAPAPAPAAPVSAPDLTFAPAPAPAPALAPAPTSAPSAAAPASGLTFSVPLAPPSSRKGLQKRAGCPY
jgi:hypothetical protein